MHHVSILLTAVAALVAVAATIPVVVPAVVIFAVAVCVEWRWSQRLESNKMRYPCLSNFCLLCTLAVAAVSPCVGVRLLSFM